MTDNFFIRDTLVRYDALKTLPYKNIKRLLTIKKEFNGLGYIDFRTAMGPDQIRRITKTQSRRLDVARIKAFQLESETRQLLKTSDEIERDNKVQAEKEKQDKLNGLLNRKMQIESFLSRQLNSKRDNITKREYQSLLEDIELVNKGA